MISARMFQIIKYLDDNRSSNYKEICKILNIKERNIRYDIDCINDELSIKELPQIEKHSKGKLIIPKELNLQILLQDQEFLFSNEEREEIIKLTILFSISTLNITKLSNFFMVSRRTIQNDMDVVMKDLKTYSMQLVYDKTFTLIEEYDIGYTTRVNELKKYIYLINKRQEQYNIFETYIMQFIQNIFIDIDVKQIYHWVNNRIETMNWKFSDTSFDWYVSNILTTCWCILNLFPLPLYKSDIDIENNSVEEIGNIIKRKLTNEQKKLISSFSNYTNKYVDIDINLDLIMTEDMISQLVSMVSEDMGIYFMRDMILIKGLLNHVAPMLERLKGNIQMYALDTTIIPDNYMYVFETITKNVKRIPFLSALAKEELIYLSIHFIGSIQRLRNNDYKRVLLVCGLGYGAIALMKDTLRNEYQVQIVENISAYQLDNYTNWQNIDIVISTSRVNLPVIRPLVIVNAIFSLHDHDKLESVGIRKKNVLTNYIAIEKRLDFLKEPNRHKVLSIIKEELGYMDVTIPNKYYNLSDLLGVESIRIVESIDNWKKAVQQVTNILEKNGCILKSYCLDIQRGIEESGFYSVTDQKFALFHGGDTDSVNVSSMSLIISKEPVLFGNKKSNIIFCLASKDKKEHIPAVVMLMRIVNNTTFLNDIKQCRSGAEVMEVIYRCEIEVLSSYL